MKSKWRNKNTERKGLALTFPEEHEKTLEGKLGI